VNKNLKNENKTYHCEISVIFFEISTFLVLKNEISVISQLFLAA